MHAKLRLSHDEITVLTAIADQELTLKEVGEEVNLAGDPNAMAQMQALLSRMADSELLKRWTITKFLFPTTLYAIAPEILALNNPPYSYESWRVLSE